MKMKTVGIVCSFAVVALVGLLLLFLRCSPDNPAAEIARKENTEAIRENVSFAELKEISQRLKARAQEAGYWVGQGGFLYFQKEHFLRMIVQAGDCYGNNPGFHYGVYMVPPAPGESPDVSLDLSGFYRSPEKLKPVWRMRGDEVIVFIGLTPPRSRYFSFIPYIYSTSPSRRGMKSDRERASLLAGFGRPLNDDVISTSGKDSSFGAATIVLLAASKQSEAAIRNLLQDRVLSEHGMGEDIINTLRIPADVALLGHGRSADEFAVISRVANPEDEAAAKEYFNNPPMNILRMVPRAPEKLDLEQFTHEPLPSRRTGTNEAYLSGALDALVEAVRSRQGSATRKTEVVTGRSEHITIFDCLRRLERGRNCGGNNQDALYFSWGARRMRLADSPDSFLMIAGVNHVKTGKAKYNGFSIKNTRFDCGVDSVFDRDYEGSAEQYVEHIPPSHPGRKMLVEHANKFFVYKISRACNGEKYCYEMPENTAYEIDHEGNIAINEQGVFGVDLDDEFKVFERTYRDPRGVIGPSVDEVLYPRLIIFTPPDEDELTGGER